MNEIKNVLLYFPTNLGDAAMGLPALDKIRAAYPQGKITVIASEITKELFSALTSVDKVMLFNKRWNIKEKLKFSLGLRKKYEVVADLKNSFLSVIAAAPRRTPFFRIFPADMHSRDRYLFLIRKLLTGKEKTVSSGCIISREKQKYWETFGLPPSVFIACSSRSHLKYYPYEYLKEVVKFLQTGNNIVIIGEETDKNFYKDILSLDKVMNLTGKTTLSDVVYLLKNYAKLVLCVDSGIMHLASYLNLPIVAIFGPSNPQIYGPWSEKHLVVKNEQLDCLGCQKAQCKKVYQCMEIAPEKVISAINQIIDETT